MRAARVLGDAIKASGAKIAVFLLVVLTIVVIAGTLMYIIEGAEHGFDSIPHSIYWAIVTLTTVGYGDISPGTPVGMFLASLLMIMGYGVIAVPTGIVGIELSQVTTFRRARRPNLGLRHPDGSPEVQTPLHPAAHKARGLDVGVAENQQLPEIRGHHRHGLAVPPWKQNYRSWGWCCPNRWYYRAPIGPVACG